MRTVGSYEAKTHLPRLLNEVARGDEILITRRGIPIARLVPANDSNAETIERTIARIQQYRRGLRLGGLSLREIIEEGRS